MSLVLSKPDLTNFPDYRMRRRQTFTRTKTRYEPSKRDFIASFYAVLRRWESETKFCSNPDLIISHPSFVALVANAGDVIQLIREELSRQPSYLIWVLEEHFGEMPYSEDVLGNIEAMTECWLVFLEEQR